VLVRDRTQADLAACLDIARTVQARDNYPPRGAVDDDWFIAPPEQLAAWVAEEGSSIAGHVALHSAPNYVSTRLASSHLACGQDELGVVARLFVDPANRGSGIGEALLARATAAAVDRSLYPMLDVATHLSNAVALYESAGWERIGEVVLDAWDEETMEPLPLYVYVLSRTDRT
jgi:GNAT superfamily N-acetyltransferase